MTTQPAGLPQSPIERHGSAREIRAMEPDVIAQIKAGEVIERPASVVKELLENAIDAGASRVRVELEEGGTKLIRLIDDGCGIEPRSLELAFAEHTSSKLHSAEELDGIQTLGFRGEALYAISNVARVEAISGLRQGEACVVVFDHGVLVKREPAAPGGGTRFAVEDIFAKVPARRKHLRSARSETAAVHQVVAQYAIAHPSVAISLHADKKPVFASPGTGSIKEAFASVYGLDLLDRMVPLAHDGSVSISGLVSPPSVSRPNRSAIHIFVNGRPVRSAALTFAVEDAMAGLLMVGRHPLAAISIRVPADQVDPNVHPTKQEVRFLADRPVFAAVRAAVAEAVASTGILTHDARPLGPRDAGELGFELPIPEPERRPYPEDISWAADEPSPNHAATPGPGLPRLRVFGQAAQTFIIAEGPAGLYMIDQHAAHERVLFDALCDLEGSPHRQPLLAPASLALNAAQVVSFEAHGTDLQACGFDVEPFGDGHCVVRAVPLVGGSPVEAETVLTVLDALSEAGSPEAVMNEALTVVACKAAVKAGDSLSMAEMRQLVESLEATPNPRTCPHGRPTTIHISTERLEREFGRR